MVKRLAHLQGPSCSPFYDRDGCRCSFDRDMNLTIRFTEELVVLLSPKIIRVWNQYFCYWLSISPIFLPANRFNLSLTLSLTLSLKSLALLRSQVIIIIVSSTIEAHTGPEIIQKRAWDGGVLNSLMFMPKY